MNKFERHNIDLNKLEMDGWSVFSSIVICAEYNHLQTDIDIHAQVDRQPTKLFAKHEDTEHILKVIYYGKHADKVKEDFQDIYESIQSELNCVARYLVLQKLKQIMYINEYT